MGWLYLGIFSLVALVLSAVGFYKFVYFLSVGYGLSVAGIGLTLAVLSAVGTLEAVWPMYLLYALLVVYGLRLSGFLLLRELKSISFKKTEVFKDTLKKEESKKVPIFVEICIWICVAALYVAQTSPAFFRAYNFTEKITDKCVSPLLWVGIAVCLFAVVLETLADHQKSVQKAANPNKVATKGLYRIVRCPNYLGEILFWTGVTLSSLDVLHGVGQWALALVGYVCIVYIMFNGAQRLEKRQMARYGNDPEYNAYADSTPIILPLIPLYHLNKKQ